MTATWIILCKNIKQKKDLYRNKEFLWSSNNLESKQRFLHQVFSLNLSTSKKEIES